MDTLFVLKKLLGSLLMPLPVLLLCLVVCLCLVIKGYRKSAIWGGSVVLLGLYCLSIPPVVNSISKPLEWKYSKYQAQPVQYVVVLGSSHNSDSDRPLSSMLDVSSLTRLLEGVTVYRQNPGAKLLVSGYKASDKISNARAVSLVAIEMGVPVDDIILAEDVKDTAEEAAHWAELIDGQTFALVTSAIHMPRSVYLFEQALGRKGHELSNIIPAPTKHTSSKNYRFRGFDLVPRARQLERTAAAWHEYLGYLWARLQAK